MFVTTKLLQRWPARRPRLLLLIVLGCGLAAGAGVVGWAALRPGPAAAAHVAPPAALDPAEPALALVFVSGAVAHPGLYRLSAGARVADAIAAAGGLTPDADSGRLPNLAARVHDGHQVNVPFRKTTAARSASEKLDVNTATLDELRAVPGMPLGLPEAIVSYRQLYGGFRSLSDMRVMLGLDAAVVTSLRAYLRVVPVSP
jgi:competence protein ComEA